MDLTLFALTLLGSSGATLILQKILSHKSDRIDLLATLQDRLHSEIGRLEEKIRVLEANEELAQQLERKLTLRIEELEKENSRLTFRVEILQRQLDERDFTQS